MSRREVVVALVSVGAIAVSVVCDLQAMSSPLCGGALAIGVIWMDLLEK